MGHVTKRSDSFEWEGAGDGYVPSIDGITFRRGHPACRPPRGQRTALVLNIGRKRWRIPFGRLDGAHADGKPVLGLQNIGGVAATAGGLRFATGTTENMSCVFDVATGGLYAGCSERSNRVITFTLPASAR